MQVPRLLSKTLSEDDSWSQSAHSPAQFVPESAYHVATHTIRMSPHGSNSPVSESHKDHPIRRRRDSSVAENTHTIGHSVNKPLLKRKCLYQTINHRKVGYTNLTRLRRPMESVVGTVFSQSPLMRVVRPITVRRLGAVCYGGLVDPEWSREILTFTPDIYLLSRGGPRCVIRGPLHHGRVSPETRGADPRTCPLTEGIQSADDMMSSTRKPNTMRHT